MAYQYLRQDPSSLARHITAPDDEAAARTKAIEYFHIERALEFRVVATKLDKLPSSVTR